MAWRGGGRSLSRPPALGLCEEGALTLLTDEKPRMLKVVRDRGGTRSPAPRWQLCLEPVQLDAQVSQCLLPAWWQRGPRPQPGPALGAGPGENPALGPIQDGPLLFLRGHWRALFSDADRESLPTLLETSQCWGPPHAPRVLSPQARPHGAAGALLMGQGSYRGPGHWFCVTRLDTYIKTSRDFNVCSLGTPLLSG